jgi:pyruvate/2-oxoacid:ferredoxin oxidoreductase beta subunit
VIANATGCSSVRFDLPFNPYNDPWVNSLFQDTPAVAKGSSRVRERAAISPCASPS